MNEAAFNEMVAVIDDAIAVADEAVKAADEKTDAPAEEPVTLVKVAHSRFQETAKELIKTGAFTNHTVESLTNTLEQAQTLGLLELMEKMASKAVFSLDAATALNGDLVEKPSPKPQADHRLPGESDTDLWERSCREAGLQV